MRTKRFISILLTLTLLLGSVPATAFAAGSTWSVTVSGGSYDASKLDVRLYSAADGAFVQTEWTTSGSSITATAARTKLFASGGDYYAVLQYTEAGSSSGGGGGGGYSDTNLSDAEINTEFVKFYAAALANANAKLPEGLPADYPAETESEAIRWYNAAIADEDFADYMGFDDEDPAPTVAELREQAEDYGSTLVGLINELAENYMECYEVETYNVLNRDVSELGASDERYIIENAIRMKQMAVEYAEYLDEDEIADMLAGAYPPGYEPPAGDSGSGSGDGGDDESDAAISVRVTKLTDSQKTNGLTVSAGYFDGCLPVAVTGPVSGVETPVYLYADAGEQWIPAYIAPKAGSGYGDYGDYGDYYGDYGDYGDYGSESDVLPGGDEAPDTAQALPSGYVWKFYPGTYLAATVADTNTGTYVDPYEGDCIADWEVFTLSGSGANIDFSTGRTYTDVSIGSGLADPASYTILMAYLSQGELRNATLGVSLSTMFTDEPKPLRVKKDAFSFVQVSETDFTVDEDTGIYTGTGVYYTRTVSGLGSAVNWTIPTLEDSFTASLSFHDAEGKTGRFTPGQDVSGQLHLVHDGWEMTTAFAFAMEMTGEDDGSDENSTYATLRVRAVCEDGTELTTEETDMATVFSFKAPAATTRVTATATLKMEGMIDRSFGPATAPIVVGEGGDMEPPAVPAGFAGTATATEVSFTWTKNTDYDLDGYTIYFVDKNDIATPVGTAGKDAASATFPIDYAAWGVEGWRFAIAAFDDTGNESERCAPASAMPDAGNLKGTLALSAASGYGTYADGRFTLNGSNAGRAQFAYTPDAGAPAISGGTLLLVYRDVAGATQTATVSGSYSGSATWTIPADAACLLAAACTCSEGTILKSLSETPIVAHITVKNNAGASYTLATSFDSGRILMGVRTAATLEKSGSNYVGDLSRDLYRDATLEFFADSERFRAVKKLQALSTGSDAFAVGVNDLPQKVKLVVNGAFEREDLDINAYFPTGNTDDPYITATRGSVRKTEDGLVCFFERPVSAASIGTIVFDLDVDANDAAYVLEYTAGGSLTTAGAAFATGSTYTIGAHLKVANLEQFMYLDVRCVGGIEEKEPYQDLWFTLTDDTGKTRNVSWYHKTKQLDTKELTAGKTYHIDYYNYYIHNVFDMGDQTVKIVNGEASYSPMKKVTMGEQAVVRVNLQFYTDENGVPGREGGSKNFQADYDVYYMNATTHAWTPLSGQLNHFSDTSAGASSAGLTSWFESEPIAADLLDTEAGLKLVLADSGYLVARESNIGYINGAGVTHGYVIPGEEVRLVEDQVFYTDMRPENGGISSVNMAATIEDLRANDWENHLSNYYQNYALTWTIGSVDDNGDIHSGMISGFALAQMPRIDLHLTRGAENLLLTFALRNTATGETYRYDRNMIGNGTADSVKQYALDGLPYGTYDVLMTLGSGSDVLQLVSQFMNGADTVVPDTVCGLLEKNVAVTPADAVIDLTLDPWSVDENVPGIQGIAVTPSKDYVLTGERVNYSLRFTCIPGASEEDRTLHFSGYGFALDGISAQLRTADGRAVSLQDQTVNTGDKQGTAVIPASSQKITGTIVVTGIAGGSGSYSTLHAYVGKHYEAGGIYESHTTVRDFEGTIPKTIKAANAVLSGRGSAETEITIEIAAKVDPSRKVEDTAWISRYGYWKIEMEYPIEEGQAEDFTVTIRDEHGTILKEGETAYEVETVLPYRVNVTTYCNGQKNVLTGYPGSEKDFRSLNSAAVVFGTDYEATNIELDLYFDDTNEDDWGLTDARRVHDLILSIELQSLGMDMPIYYVFQPVDEKTYTYHNDLIDLTMENVPYSTHYKVEFPAYHYGRFGISYELFDGEGDIALKPYNGISYTEFAQNMGYTASSIIEIAKALQQSGEWLTDNGSLTHTGTWDGQVMYSEPGVQYGDLTEDVVAPGTDPDSWFIEPFEERLTDVHVDKEVGFEGLTSDDIEAQIEAYQALDPGYSQVFTDPNSFVKYVDMNCVCSIETDGGESSLKIERTWHVVVDPTNIDIEEAGLMGLVEASLMDGGDGGFSIFSSEGQVVTGVVNDVANLVVSEGTQANIKVYVNESLKANDIAGKIQPRQAAKWNMRAGKLADRFGTAVNVISVGLEIKKEINGENSTAIVDLNAITNEYEAKIQKYCEKLIAMIQCPELPNLRIASQIANIKDTAMRDMETVRDHYTSIYRTNQVIHIAVSATCFIPTPPGLSTALSFIEGLARESEEAWQAFMQMKDLEQISQKAENEMYAAFRGYNPKLCDKVPPIEPINRKPPKFNFKFAAIYDPSGTVYEGMLSNPLEGVEVTIEYLEDDGETWMEWYDAPLCNEQQTTYITEANGYYRWDVPTGRWRVRYYKEGYNDDEPVYSGEMDVPPIWLDVNQNMVSRDPAEGSGNLTKTGAEVKFTKPVKTEDFIASRLTLLENGSPIAAEFGAIGEEDGLAMKLALLFEPDEAKTYILQIDGLRTYADTACTFEIEIGPMLSDTVCAVVTADVPSGTEVAYEEKVALSTPTEGADIWYTTDGSCPCDPENPARTLYTKAFSITEDVYIIAYATKDGLEDSKTAPFIYFVDGKPEKVISGRAKVDSHSATAAIYLNLEGISEEVATLIAYYADGRFLNLIAEQIDASELDGASLAKRYEFENGLENVTVQVFLVDETLAPIAESEELSD